MANDQPMWGNNRAVAPTPRAVIIAVDLGDNFTIKGHHLSMIKDRQFDGRSWADPHKHIAEFVEVCGMFCYDDTNVGAIKLKLFPLSLAGEGKIWFNKLSPDKPTQAILDAGGIFLNKTPNEAHQLLEDRVLLKLDWSKENKTKPLRKTVAFAESDENSPLLKKMEALTTRIDSHFKEIIGDMKEIRDGCNKYGGPHPSSDYDDKPLGGPMEEEENYASGGYQGGYRGNYYVEYLALDDLGVSINLMPYSLYAALFGTTLKPTRMSIRLANHTYQYHMGVAKNMFVQVIKSMFLIDFVILQMEENDRVPLILGRPFLHTVDAIIRDKNKELNLGIREDRATFHIDKAMQHSHVNDDTCFRMDVIDEITEDELDDLLDDSKPFLTTTEKISETSLDKEFD
uniref:Reverse transcriptase domain-containing protein n=1 Tax=Tanacetum cinerariifolium TaxID=118510 RepID=A0A6L2KXM2_TANCI|nr:reverse transcriptase domain-containing protein [Tanacetum cinerariifolium]